MCLFIRNFSSTEFSSFPSAQPCLCGPGAKTQPLAVFQETEGWLSRGGGALEEAWRKEPPERRERNQWPGSQQGRERPPRHRQLHK